MKVKRKNNVQFKKLLKTDHFKQTLASQEKPYKVPFLQEVTGYSRTYIFAWLAKPKSTSYLPMPDVALDLFMLEMGFKLPRYNFPAGTMGEKDG